MFAIIMSNGFSCSKESISPFFTAISEQLFAAQFSMLFSTLHSSISMAKISLAPKNLAKSASMPVPQPMSKTRLFLKSVSNMALQTKRVV